MESEGIFWMKHLFATNVNGGVRDEVLIYFKSKLKNNKTKKKKNLSRKILQLTVTLKIIDSREERTDKRMDGRTKNNHKW